LADIFRIINAASLPQILSFMLVSLIIIFKWMREHHERQELAERKRIENLTEALINKPIKNDAYILEQLFQDRYGVLLDYKEIKYFLNQENPSWLINQYISAKVWLKFNESFRYLVPRGFFYGKRFRFIIWPANFLFSISAMLGILGIIVCFMLIFEASEIKPLVQTLSVSVIAFLYAWVFYLGLSSAESAIRLKHITKKSS
jgi:hypothetical protein